MLLHIFKYTINHWRKEYIETLNLSTLWACPAQVFLCYSVEKLDSEVSDNYWSINNNIYFTIEWKDMYSKAVSFPFCQIYLYIGKREGTIPKCRLDMLVISTVIYVCKKYDGMNFLCPNISHKSSKAYQNCQMYSPFCSCILSMLFWFMILCVAWQY